MPNENAPLDIPGPVEHLRDLAAAFREFESQWVLFRNEELGDFFLQSGLPQSLINATIALYSKGRHLAAGLATAFENVKNAFRFPDISYFIRHVEDDILPSISEFEAVVSACKTELDAVLPDFDAQPFCAQWEAQVGTRGPSPWHFRDTIRDMIDLFRRQLTLLNVAAKDVAALKRAQSAVHERPTTSAEAQPAVQYAFYCVGDFWEITFEGKRAQLRDIVGLSYIHYLLLKPNVSVGVLTLRQVANKPHRPDPDERVLELRARSTRTLDTRAIDEIKQRAKTLEAEIGRAHEAGDYNRREELKRELDEVERQRRAGVYPLGRSRKKAQEAVYKAIDAAYKRIRREIPGLETYLRRSISTGYECLYTPDPDRTILWTLEPPADTRTTTPARRPRA